MRTLTGRFTTLQLIFSLLSVLPLIPKQRGLDYSIITSTRTVTGITPNPQLTKRKEKKSIIGKESRTSHHPECAASTPQAKSSRTPSEQPPDQVTDPHKNVQKPHLASQEQTNKIAPSTQPPKASNSRHLQERSRDDLKLKIRSMSCSRLSNRGYRYAISFCQGKEEKNVEGAVFQFPNRRGESAKLKKKRLRHEPPSQI